ncbi:MAG: hypothetical protein SPJ17_01865 [Anaeroplasma sp.]|nr:hypothetical protein [Anaeroplasma sp.]MDY5982437.1 hypothetical protein [Anaeroplasma sp.]
MNLGRENEIVEFKETSGEINEAVIDIVAMLNPKLFINYTTK